MHPVFALGLVGWYEVHRKGKVLRFFTKREMMRLVDGCAIDYNNLVREVTYVEEVVDFFGVLLQD